MKTIYEHSVGGDGAVAGLYVEDGFLVEKVKYPLTKATEPAKQFVNAAIDSLEAKIAGDWDKAVLEPVRVAAIAEIDKVISEI